jgi:hypothetical protein
VNTLKRIVEDLRLFCDNACNWVQRPEFIRFSEATSKRCSMRGPYESLACEPATNTCLTSVPSTLKTTASSATERDKVFVYLPLAPSDFK